MARDSARKAKQNHSPKSNPEFFDHLRSLGLATCEEYLEWCDCHGFSRRINKHWRLRAKERGYANRARAQTQLARKKEELRKPVQILERIFRGELGEKDVTLPCFQVVCKAYASAQESRHTRHAFEDLLRNLAPHSDLISGDLSIASLGRQAGNTYIEALLAIARRLGLRLRPLDAWKPQTHNARRQFASLARHLFAEWPIPPFMDSAWFLGNSEEAIGMQGWFLHLGRGENLRTCNLPVPYTKRMAHHFMQAPPDFTIKAALRWGQIRALGGDERLVRGVIGTRLGADFSHDDFWITVLQFFVANPMLDPAQIGPIVDYIHSQRFDAQIDVVGPGGAVSRVPAQPNFTMKGRTAAALLRQIEAWHRALANANQPKMEWRASGIPAFEFVEGADLYNRKIWTITELLTTKALVNEGRKMHHCVASYARSCSVGACSIWTLELQSVEGHSKILTIEVRNSSRQICQARGKHNSLPAEKHHGILRRWAAKAGLSIANHV